MSRIEKYKRKLSGDVSKNRYDAQKGFMVKQEAEATWDLVAIENQIKMIIQGQPIIYHPYYIIFGKEIYLLRKKYKAQALVNEVEIKEQKWLHRGLNHELLEQIKKLYVQIYEYLKHFHLDDSLLDGPDVLA